MITMKNTALLSSLCLLIAACGGDSEDTNNKNNATPDMAVVMDMTTTPDAAPDLAPVVIDGPEDCKDGEWFSSLGPACNACPAQPLTCALLNITDSAVTPATDTVSIRVRAGVSEPVSATLKGKVIKVSCTPETPDEPSECFEGMAYPFETAMALADNTFSLAATPPAEFGDSYGVVRLESITITDGCGVAHTIPIEAEWDVFRDMIVAPLACP
jgi:hypothetical protein